MRYTLFFTFFTFLLSFTVTAKNTLVPLDVYAENPVVSLMTISPDGSRIAYQTRQQGNKALVVKEIESGKMLGGVVIEGLNADHAYFIDNFRVIIRVSDYQKLSGYKGMHNISSAMIYDIRTKKMKQLLISGRGISDGQTQLGSLVGLSPDRKIAYMPAYFKKFTASRELIYTLMKVSLDKKISPKSSLIGSKDAIDFFVDEAGEPIARELYNKKYKRHSVESYIDGEWVIIFSEITPYRYRGFSGVTADRKSIIMTVTGDNGRRQFFTMSLRDGAISEPIFVNDNADVEHVLTDIQRVVYGVQYSGFKPSYAFFNKKQTKTFAAIQSAMPEASFSLVDHTPDWAKIIFKLEGGQQAGEYILFANNSFSFLASSRPKISAEMVNPIIEYSYKARDGYEIPTLLTYPKSQLKSKEKLPAIVMPHGGPELYDTIHFDWLAQYLSNRGILVIQPQFRGSKGFGIDHLIKGRGEWGKLIQDDITDSVTALIQEGKVDPKRVCIMGASYGGYAALAGATFTPEMYQCAISINGLSDIPEMIDFERSEHGENSETFRYWQEVINRKKLDDEFLESISPINYVEKVQIPVLLIHGQRDKIVDFEQSDDFFDELEDADKDVELVELRGEGHYLLKNKSRIKALTAIDKFLNKHLL